MKNPLVGEAVIVYDRYRFAIPLKAVIARLSELNDGVQIVLNESNNVNYPVGCKSVWVHAQQLKRQKVGYKSVQDNN